LRWSKSLIPTFREVPADAEIVSHQLMLRAGLVRKLAAGVFTYLPLGWRSISRVATIVREEMNRTGAQEIVMPVLQPAEIWQESGRWYDFGRELMRLRDRHERDFALGPTHEEVITTLVRNTLRSYRQLPQNLYQIQVKFRDEIRPRFGVMRAREFMMKDAYSFHVDEDSLDQTYRDMHDAYSRIIERCGLDFRVVEADTGVIGGAESQEFMVLAANGESEILSCTACGYAANAERAELRLPPVESEEPSPEPVEVSTPGRRTVEEVSEFLGVQPAQLAKTLLFKIADRDVAVLVPGSRDLNEAKLVRLAGTPLLRMLEDAEVQELSGADVGFAGPVGLTPGTPIWADPSLQGYRSLITGANRTDAHLRGVAPGRDFQVERWADLVLAQVQREDVCHVSGRLGPRAPLRHGLLRVRRLAHRCRGDRAELRRRRHSLAASRGTGRCSHRSGQRLRRRDPHACQRAARRAHCRRYRRASRRSRAAARCEVQRRRPDRDPDSCDDRRAWSTRRQARDPRPPHGRRAGAPARRAGSGRPDTSATWEAGDGLSARATHAVDVSREA
jgi:prolyl-tRNA synthetase